MADLLGIISDSHEQLPKIKKAVQILKNRDVQFVVHCGDIISPPILSAFENLKIRFCYGNNDGEREGLSRKVRELGFLEISDELDFMLCQKHIYAYHGTLPTRIADKANLQIYDYILTGHTHNRRDEYNGKTRIINPGALSYIPPSSIAILNLSTDQLDFIEIS